MKEEDKLGETETGVLVQDLSEEDEESVFVIMNAVKMEYWKLVDLGDLIQILYD